MSIIIIQPLYPHFVAHQKWYNSHSSYAAVIWHSLQFPPIAACTRMGDHKLPKR